MPTDCLLASMTSNRRLECRLQQAISECCEVRLSGGCINYTYLPRYVPITYRGSALVELSGPTYQQLTPSELWERYALLTLPPSPIRSSSTHQDVQDVHAASSITSESCIFPSRYDQILNTTHNSCFGKPPAQQRRRLWRRGPRDRPPRPSCDRQCCRSLNSASCPTPQGKQSTRLSPPHRWYYS